MGKDTFMNDSIELKNILLQEAANFSNEIDRLERSSDELIAFYAYLKDFLINSGVLCDDILQAVHNDVVLLAMVGTRTLLEDAINVHYLESMGAESDRMAIANDWFELSNNPKAYKNKLDGKPVRQRAKDAGKETEVLHDSEYADFCNYTHSTAQRSVLNIPDQRKILGNKTVATSIKAYANIVTCVVRIVSEQKRQSLMNNANAYFEKYRASVMEATLPTLDSNTDS